MKEYFLFCFFVFCSSSSMNMSSAQQHQQTNQQGQNRSQSNRQQLPSTSQGLAQPWSPLSPAQWPNTNYGKTNKSHSILISSKLNLLFVCCRSSFI